MKKLTRTLSALLLACLLIAASPAALAAENINFGVSVTADTLADVGDVLYIVTAEEDQTAFDALKSEGKSLSFSTACAFEKAYVVYDGTLVASTLADKTVRFPVAQGGTYLVVDGTAPEVIRETGKITVRVSAQNAKVLSSFTLPCTLEEPTATLNGQPVQLTEGDGTVTLPLTDSGDYIITGKAPATTVTVTADAKTVEAGKTLQFHAKVEPAAPVTWKVTGAVSAKTSVDDKGLLTVGPDETAKTLTVTATAGTASDACTVTVTRPQPPTYKLTKGDGSKWTHGSGKRLIFESDGDITKLTAVEVDGKTLKSTDYDIKDGQLRLKSGFLDTLDKGKHTIKLHFEDGGTAQGTFSVHISSRYNPFTGDQFPLTILTTVMVLSLAGLLVLVWKKHRKK